MCEVLDYISDAEPCPCGSGVPFSKCCKDRAPVVNASRKPPEVQAMEMFRAGLLCCCMHPDQSNCHGYIKQAHALQNNKIISLLAGSSRHVYMLDPKRKSHFLPMQDGSVLPLTFINRVSANDATTETCFCDRHDNTAFTAIEKGAPDFDSSNEEMKFVYAYKAFIFEYYKLWNACEMYKKCFKHNPPAYLDKDSVGIYRMQQLQMQEFNPIKAFFDAQIMAGTHTGVFTQVIKVPKQLKFAVYAYIAPTYDLNGYRINNVDNGYMHRIAITVIPEATQSWVLMSCLETEKKYYSAFFGQLVLSPLAKIENYLTMQLPLYSENLVLSPDLWENWDEDTQIAYTHMANLWGPDAERLNMAISMGLQNASHDTSGRAYSNPPVFNLFV